MERILHRNSRVIVFLRVLLVTYLVTGLLLTLLSFIMLKANVQNGVILGGIIVTYILSTLLGGFLLGKGAEKKRFLWGLGMGLIYFIVLIFISILTNSIMGMELGKSIMVMAICMISGMIGGMLS